MQSYTTLDNGKIRITYNKSLRADSCSGGLFVRVILLCPIIYGIQRMNSVRGQNGSAKLSERLVVFLASMVLVAIYEGDSIENKMNMQRRRVVLMECGYYLVNSPNIRAYFFHDLR